MFKIDWNKTNFTSEEIFDLEIKQFFSPSNFIGVKPMMDGRNSFVLDFLSKRYILTKTDEYNLLKNSCVHKNARLAIENKDIKKDRLICPVHFWSYDLNGTLLSTPCCNLDCKNNQLSIKSQKQVFDFKMFLLTSEALTNELKSSEFLKDFDFSDFVVLDLSSYEQRGNWKTYGIVFNDSSHIKFFHPEMIEIVKDSSIEWESSDNYVAHRLKINPNWQLKQNNRFTKYFKKIESLGIDTSNDGINDYVVTWVNIFPNVFIDFWAKQVNIVFIEPLSLDRYMIHNFWLCHKSLLNENETNKLFLDAMNTVENEDNVIITKVHDGMMTNYETDVFTEYIFSPLENGDLNYHQWLMNNGSFYFR